MSTTSFSDLTNITQDKRQRLTHGSGAHQPRKIQVTKNVTIEELNAKIDCFSQKLDLIYDMLLTLLSQKTGITQPIAQAAGVIETSPFVSHKENGQSAAVPCKDALQQCGVQLSQSDAVVCAEQQQRSTPPASQVTFAKDEEPESRDHKRFAVAKRTGSGGVRNGGGDLSLWPKSNCFIVLVEFKCQRVKRCESDEFIVPGQYAIVQGDRGYDCGVVNQCSEWCAEKGCFTREESLDGTVVNVIRMKSDIGRVLRVATEEEVERLFGEIARNENLALKTCREIVTRMALEMDVVDCEYQFDQQKISFYYEASHSIDFRQLNSELYRIFGVRIWLQNVNSAVKNVVPTGAMSKDDKAQYQRSGLRPQLLK